MNVDVVLVLLCALSFIAIVCLRFLSIYLFIYFGMCLSVKCFNAPYGLSIGVQCMLLLFFALTYAVLDIACAILCEM